MVPDRNPVHGEKKNRIKDSLVTSIGKKTFLLREVPSQTQAKLQSTSLVCPLCSASIPARGLRPKAGPDPSEQHWEIVYTCPACGLISTFDIDQLSLRLLRSIQGTQWSTLLRQYHTQPSMEEVAQERQATPYHFFSVFVISYLTWIVLTGSFGLINLLWGVAASLVVARFAYRLVAFNLPRWVTSPRRWLAFFSLMFELARQLVVQNISLSIRVLRPDLPIRPGIVAVPTRLRSDIELTLLGSLITLTPDTVVVDIDQKNGLIYVHWIDVQASAPEEVRRRISASFEEKIIRWLQ